MDNDQFEKLLQAVADKQHASRNGEALEVISKIAIGVCTTGILIIGGFLINMNTNMALFAKGQLDMKEEIVEMRREMDDRDEAFREFTDKPRFTADDDDKALAPIHKSLTLLKNELEARASFMDDTDDRLERLEREFDFMERQKRDD